LLILLEQDDLSLAFFGHFVTMTLDYDAMTLAEAHRSDVWCPPWRYACHPLPWLTWGMLELLERWARWFFWEFP